MGERIYGVDLGTTYTTAAWVDEARTVCTLQNPDDPQSQAKALASTLYFNAPGEVIVGESGRRECVKARGKVSGTAFVTGAKRYIGLPIPEPTELMGSDPLPPYHAFEVAYSAVEASACILKKLKLMVDAQQPTHPLEKMVLTHPHFFKEPQKAATRLAAKLAGIEVVEMMSEPNAAALACLSGASAVDQKVMVFDLGGGTLDITLFEVNDGQFSWKGGAGDPYLGGRDFDDALFQLVIAEWNQRTGLDFLLTTSGWLRPKADDAIQKLKRGLQDPNQPAEIGVLLMGGDLENADSPPAVQIRVSRDRFDAGVRSIVDRARECVQKALRDTRPQWMPEDVDHAVVVGGSGRLRVVHSMLEDLSFKVHRYRDMDAAIAQGAAMRAEDLREGKAKPVQAPASAGSAPVAQKVSGLSMTAVPPAPLAYSVGVKAWNGATKQHVVSWLAHKGEPISQAGCEQEFSTTQDDAAEVEVELFEADPGMFHGGAAPPDQCTRVGAVRLPVPKGPRGQKVLVKIGFERSGIVVVRVTDPKSGKSSHAEVERSTAVVASGPGDSSDANQDLNLDSVTHMQQRLTRLRVR